MLKNRPFTLFVFLCLIFFIPLVGAWVLFTYHSDWMHGTVNKGILIKPMLRIENLPLIDEKTNAAFNPQQWKDHWVLLYLNNNACDTTCLKMVQQISQTRKALGKYQEKIFTAYASTHAVADRAKFFERFPGTYLLKTNLSAIAPFLGQPDVTAQVLKTGEVFLVDPQGYVMMRYPINGNAEDAFHDLQHLLNLEGE